MTLIIGLNRSWYMNKSIQNNFFSFLPSSFLPLSLHALKSTLGCLYYSMCDSAKFWRYKKGRFRPCCSGTPIPLGTPQKDKARSTNAADTGELSVLKEMAKSKVWMQERIWGRRWMRRARLQRRFLNENSEPNMMKWFAKSHPSLFSNTPSDSKFHSL